MSATTPELVFTIEYGCGNCGDTWTDSFRSRTVVSTAQGQVYFADKRCDEFVQQCEDGCCSYVRCPTCELYDDVEIQDRYPVEDGEVDE